ncbi:MAG: acetylornithine transaminase [Acidimicrobiales bacterium]|nr:acetylornithine transaminase [Acidimicrobiales bacterium]
MTAVPSPKVQGDQAESPLMGTYPPPAVTFARGEGSFLWDTDGRQYLDFFSGIAVTSLGHCHPAVAEAVATQAHTLVHVSNHFGNTIGPEVATTIDRLIGDGNPAGGRVFFANSGAEANECAIKVARRFAGPGRHVVVSAFGSFHGRTLATLAATGQPAKHEPFQPLPPGFRYVAWDDPGDLERALDPTVAAVMLEPLEGEGGVVTAASGFLAEVRRICDEREVLLICDEVQTGFGRTGRWFGFQHEGIAPDVVTMAKALGNGMPIGACWARSEVAAAFRSGDHGSTFGGQPLAASAARATLSVMQSEDVPARARRAGARLRQALQGMPGVDRVRGLGLLLGAVLTRPLAQEVAASAMASGLIVNAVAADVVRLSPSLLVTDEEIDQATAILGKVLETTFGGPT